MTTRKSEGVQEFVEERIEAWHDSDSENTLHEFLGWSWEEYKAFMETNIIPQRTIVEYNNLTQ